MSEITEPLLATPLAAVGFATAVISRVAGLGGGTILVAVLYGLGLTPLGPRRAFLLAGLPNGTVGLFAGATGLLVGRLFSRLGLSEGNLMQSHISPPFLTGLQEPGCSFSAECASCLIPVSAQPRLSADTRAVWPRSPAA